MYVQDIKLSAILYNCFVSDFLLPSVVEAKTCIMDLSNINLLALLTATIASFGLGALWYSPVLFGKLWQKETGLSEEELKDANMAKIFGTCFFLTAVMAFGMAVLIQGHGQQNLDWLDGLQHGLFVGLLFVATSMGINYLYQRKSIKLWLIDAGYQLAFLALQGLIFAVWT